MAYGKKHIQSNIIRSICFKLCRILVKNFPLNRTRVWALRQLGFKIGKKVYIANGLTLTIFNAKSNCFLEIGDRVAIGPNVTLIMASDANWSKLNEIIPPIEGSITIHQDSWIGAGSIILPNVIIDEMSIIAAGSVVTKNVASFTIVGGVPARKLNQIKKKNE